MSPVILGVLKLGKSNVFVEITGRIDRRSFEALRMDISAVARRHGLTVRKIALRGSAKRKKKR
jgi:hypothetical protein